MTEVKIQEAKKPLEELTDEEFGAWMRSLVDEVKPSDEFKDKCLAGIMSKLFGESK